MGTLQGIPLQHRLVPPIQWRQAGNLRGPRAAAVERAGATEATTLVDEVPLVDLAQIRAGDSRGRQRVAAACRDWGFFQVS